MFHSVQKELLFEHFISTEMGAFRFGLGTNLVSAVNSSRSTDVISMELDNRGGYVPLYSLRITA